MLSNSPIVLNETRLNIKNNKLSRWETFSNHTRTLFNAYWSYHTKTGIEHVSLWLQV